jgi:DNA-binding HxlR family transcriptional regulator
MGRAPLDTYLCPVDVPIRVLGGKWKLIIVFYLLQAPRRNGELRRLIPPINQKMLTQQLRDLEADGIIIRTVVDQVPPKVVYDIVPAQRAGLEPVLQALCNWGIERARQTNAVIEALENPGRR